MRCWRAREFFKRREQRCESQETRSLLKACRSTATFMFHHHHRPQSCLQIVSEVTSTRWRGAQSMDSGNVASVETFELSMVDLHRVALRAPSAFARWILGCSSTSCVYTALGSRRQSRLVAGASASARRWLVVGTPVQASTSTSPASPLQGVWRSALDGDLGNQRSYLFHACLTLLGGE